MKEQTFIPLAKPNIRQNEIDIVGSVLKSGMLVQGKFVDALENEITNITQTSHASALSNGTATLHLALLALGIKPGDEVIVPAFSYVATANVVELIGAKPVFVDIDISTFNIDTNKIESAITPATKAIIPVHEFGLACDIGEVLKIAKKHNIFVIEDAACALGAKFEGQHVGSFGDFGSFSFHPRKAISSGEGGILVSNDINRDKKIKILRNHGVEYINGMMEFTEFGFNYRMTDMQAAMVVSQLPNLNSSIEYKQKLAYIYFENIKTKKIKLPTVPSYAKHTWQTFHVLLDDSINRDQLIQSLKSKMIGTNYGAQCIPAVNVYKRKYNYDCKAMFPNALLAYECGLALPIYDLLTEDQLNYITKTLNQILV